MAFDAERVGNPAPEQRVLVLGQSFSCQLSADAVAAKTAPPPQGIMHAHHRRVLAVTFGALKRLCPRNPEAGPAQQGDYR